MTQTSKEIRETLKIALQDFGTLPLKQAALAFWNSLQYHSDRVIDLDSIQDVLEFKPEAAEPLQDLKEVISGFHVLFQLTADEVRNAGQPGLGFHAGRFENAIIDSYLFVALELKEGHYTRSKLAEYTRDLNKTFSLPVIVLFKVKQCISVAVIQRRLNKRDENRDVLEKVTLIRDIDLKHPHRAHLDILAALNLPDLLEGRIIGSFVELEKAWGKALDTQALNESFFKELSNWFYWAAGHPGVSFPDEKDVDSADERGRRRQVSLIRLITRLMFVWFLREKRLVPADLFDAKALGKLLNNFQPEDEKNSSFYQAILQNLFFATLNSEMGEGRKWISDKKSFNPNYGSHNVYRYPELFQNPEDALKAFADVPFLNGGLFECLDIPSDSKNNIPEVRIDGFSTKEAKRAQVPNELFFKGLHREDLNSVYGTKGKRYEVRGLIQLLERYKFTVTENTPIEEEVALDPELLGKAFENLLAAYNPETEETARKKTGSFYTPKNVVDFMVDEALTAHLEKALGGENPTERIRDLLDYSHPKPYFSEEETKTLIQAIDGLKILDPACGSGAFPIGVLQKLVYVLGRLDENNALWKDQQKERELAPEIERIRSDQEKARSISDEEVRTMAEEKLGQRLQQIEQAFNDKYAHADYARKLFLIENCIYGVDIQPIAVQIAKLRCFISLVIDQKENPEAPNRGILPLPNLETQFVAANTLMKLTSSDKQGALSGALIDDLKEQLKEVRHKHFLARTRKEKMALRDQDQSIRKEISEKLVSSGWRNEEAQKIVAFDLYNQNSSAGFFDAEWMFGLKVGFDIVIGNPPYVKQQNIKEIKLDLKLQYKFFTGTADLFVYFFERGLNLLNKGGVLTYICSNKYFRSGYGERMRKGISENFTIRQIIDFGDADIFDAIAYPSIVVFENTKPTTKSQIQAFTWSPDKKYALSNFREIIFNESFLLPQKALGADGWRIEAGDTLGLLDKLRKVGITLGEYTKGKLYRGIVTGLNEAFVIDIDKKNSLEKEDSNSSQIIKPFLRGKDIRKWEATHKDIFLIFTRQGTDIDNYPAIKNHLEAFRPDLQARLNVIRDGDEWFQIPYSISYYRDFEEPKIVYQEIATYQAFAWDESGCYTNNKAFIISGTSKYLLAILNSKVMYFQLNHTVQKMAGGAFAMQAIYLQNVAIAQPTPEAEALITTLVNYILDLSKLSSNSNITLMISYFEQLIDALVYELYLSEDLHAAGRYPLEVLSKENWPENPSLEELQTLFNRIFSPQHEIRKLIFFLDSLPVVRLIEGKGKDA